MKDKIANELPVKELQETVKKLLAKGKGILAADESNGTCNKRLATVGIEVPEGNDGFGDENGHEIRRQYRETLFEMPGLENYVSGIIFYDETFWQKNDAGMSFVESLEKRGIVPGIKVDIGVVDLPGFADEKITEGLDGLSGRLKKYADAGAKFTKWRAVIKIDEDTGLPTHECIEANAFALGRYARIVQEAGLVPIVEPEVLLSGKHSIDVSEEITTLVVRTVFNAVKKMRAYLPGVILKTSMVINGDENPSESSVDEVAQATVRMLNSSVPKEVGGVVFLSGGQTPVEATAHLDAIAEIGPTHWEIAFSYARALQDPALKAWSGKRENVSNAREEFKKRLELNQLADSGDYRMELEYSE